MESGHETVDDPASDDLDSSECREARWIEEVGAKWLHEELKVTGMGDRGWGKGKRERPAGDDTRRSLLFPFPLPPSPIPVTSADTFNGPDSVQLLRCGTVYAYLYTPPIRRRVMRPVTVLGSALAV